jgi:hypothetical protein
VSSTNFAVKVYVVVNVPHVAPFEQPTKVSVPLSWYVRLGLNLDSVIVVYQHPTRLPVIAMVKSLA